MKREAIRYPIGVQSFEELREEGYVYVDKTGYIPQLLRNKYYFLSRPRRFGKSLLLSTLEAYFRGKKELFEGLAVYDWEKDWTEYPVVHIDFNTFSSEAGNLIGDLREQLELIALQHSLPQAYPLEWVPEKLSIGALFNRLVYLLARKTGRNVVILIDEYDTGLLDIKEDERVLKAATEELRPFFNVLKSSDRYIKFAFVTGVSRFRNTTLFSGANNLIDISMDSRFASLLGISHREMQEYFRDSVADLAEDKGWTYEETLEELRLRYDGYRFSGKEEWVYNPFSLLNALDAKELGNYWISTGSTVSLARHLKDSRFDLQELTERWVRGEELGSTYTRENPLSLLFQTGYLTIRECDGPYYRLCIPNQEVQSTLVNLVIPRFVKGESEKEDTVSGESVKDAEL